MQDKKLLALLDVVIDNYISKGDPVGSKFLNSLEDVEYAPSTLRKYLNILEQSGLVYQPYNSSGRIPTLDGLIAYVENCLANQKEELDLEVADARKGIKYIVETLGSMADGVVVGFLRNDEYYYLGMNNLLREDLKDDYDVTRQIMKFIENRSLVKSLDKNIIKRNKVYYTFIQDKGVTISCMYAKIVVNEYECVLSIVGPTRVDYKKNISLLTQIVNSLN